MSGSTFLLHSLQMKVLSGVVLLLALSGVTHGQENGASPKPYVSTLHQTVDRALLQCDVNGAFPKPEVQWQDSEGKVIPAINPEVTERGGRYDVTLQAIVHKTDRYRCVSTQEEIKHIVASKTFVLIHGASPKLYITTLQQTKDSAQLQCVIRGASPRPKVQWQDSQGNIVPAKEPQVAYKAGRRDVILQTTVTKTDRYRCVVTQQGFLYQTDAETFVFINGTCRDVVLLSLVAVLLVIAEIASVILTALIVFNKTVVPN